MVIWDMINTLLLTTVAVEPTFVVACEQALLFGRASKPRENARARGRGKESLQRSFLNFHFHPGKGTPQKRESGHHVPQIRKVTTTCQVETAKGA